jgi:hypothetical protein
MFFVILSVSEESPVFLFKSKIEKEIRQLTASG